MKLNDQERQFLVLPWFLFLYVESPHLVGTTILHVQIFHLWQYIFFYHLSVVVTILRAAVPRRLISCFGDVRWPPRFPDLTTQDFLLWGYLKLKGFININNTLHEIKKTLLVHGIPVHGIKSGGVGIRIQIYRKRRREIKVLNKAYNWSICSISRHLWSSIYIYNYT